MSKHILVAKDEPSVRQLLELVLKNEGYTVSLVSNGEELIQAAQKHKPDLILTDLVLPVMDGYWAIAQLRKISRTRNIPIIILTAKATPTDLVTGFEVGADDYITIPFILPELLARIKSQLRRISYNTEDFSYLIQKMLLYALDVNSILEISRLTFKELDVSRNSLPEETAVILSYMQRIILTMQSYVISTSPINKRDSILESNEIIKIVDERMKSVSETFDFLAKSVLKRWQEILTTEGATLAHTFTQFPLINPYIVGNPVHGDIFVGREDILHRFVELWGQGGHGPSIIIYGHRRMGKSSILQNLQREFDTQTVIVDFNMQRVGRVKSTGELLLNLALKLYDTACDLNLGELAEPGSVGFIRSPYIVFDRFLNQLDRVRNNHRFIIAVDEFELIEEQINEGRLDAHLLAHWRSVFMTYPWIIMAFAGLHRLEELRHDYWHPLFGSVTAIEVSFLSPEAARRLITQPSPDFAIDYDVDAIDIIIALTHGQPYLVQLICHGLVTRFNRQTFEEGVERKRRFSLVDVEAVINAPELFRDGYAYFSGVWAQAETSLPVGQTSVLRSLSHDPLALQDIIDVTTLSVEQVHNALEALCVRAVVEKYEDSRYGFTVELMRRWVTQLEASSLIAPPSHAA